MPAVLRGVYIGQGGFKNHIEKDADGYKARIREVLIWTDFLNNKMPKNWYVGDVEFFGDRHYPLIGLDSVGLADQMACGAPDGKINTWSLQGDCLKTFTVADAIPLRLFAVTIEESPHLVAACQSSSGNLNGKVLVWRLTDNELVAERILGGIGPLRDAGLSGGEVIVIRDDEDKTAITALTLPGLAVRDTAPLEQRFERLHIGHSVAFLQESFDNSGALWKFSPLNLTLEQKVRQGVTGVGLVPLRGDDYLVTEQPNLKPPVRLSKFASGVIAKKFGVSYPFNDGDGHLVDVVGRTYAGQKVFFAPTSEGYMRVWDVAEGKTLRVLGGLMPPGWGNPHTRNWHVLPLPDGMVIADENGVPQLLKPIERLLPKPKPSTNPFVVLALLATICGLGYLAWTYRPQNQTP